MKKPKDKEVNEFVSAIVGGGVGGLHGLAKHPEETDAEFKGRLRAKIDEADHDKDDIAPENVWFYCMECDEEYHLPEDSITCPICDYDDLREL